MKNFIILLNLLFLIFPIFSQDIKVANYSTGEQDTDEYEEFSFWIEKSRRAEILYVYGKWRNQKEYKLNYLGKTVIDNKECFKVRFDNNYELYIIPDGIELIIIDKNKKYNKLFKWKYEGPVNGIGTFCSICAQDENEAIELIKKYFME